MLRALLATLVVAALIAAVPAAGLAQDAGSNQYQDPLAGEPGTKSGTPNKAPSGGGNTPSAGTQGVQSGSGTDTSAADTSRDQLPATGSDSWLLALAGAMLLGGGLGLRRLAERPTA